MWVGILALGCAHAPVQRAERAADVVAGAGAWELWTSGQTRLRGANFYQRRVYPELDHDALGDGPVGPRYSDQDLRALRALGANYVHLSCPGIFAERPPYALD